VKVAKIGEFGLLDRIIPRLGRRPDFLLIGPGDDAALWRPTPGWEQLITCDCLVEGVHFDTERMDFYSVGWRAMTANLSDIAAMGGVPRLAVVTLALPLDVESEHVDELVRGMVECGGTADCAIAGGDLSASGETLFISLTVSGEVEPGRVLTRSGAGAGNIICLSGNVGGSRVGLEVLMSGAGKNDYPASVERFLQPRPRIDLARRLARSLALTAMIDVSDGLVSDLGHICSMSGLGCRLRTADIVIDEEVVSWAGAMKKDPLEYILSSGEEYELLFTVSPEQAEIIKEFPEVRIIGEMTKAAERLIIDHNGSSSNIERQGWDHFLQ